MYIGFKLRLWLDQRSKETYKPDTNSTAKLLFLDIHVICNQILIIFTCIVISYLVSCTVVYYGIGGCGGVGANPSFAMIASIQFLNSLTLVYTEYLSLPKHLREMQRGN